MIGSNSFFNMEKDALILTADSTLPVVGGFSGPEIPLCRFIIQTGNLNTKTKMYWEVKTKTFSVLARSQSKI